MTVVEAKKTARKEEERGKESEAEVDVKDVAQSKKCGSTGTDVPKRDARGRFLKRNETQGTKRNGANGSRPKNGSTEQDGHGARTKAGPITEAGQRRLVSKLLGKADELAQSNKFKLSAGDLIRLIQLQKEFTAKTPRQLTVQWVEDKSE